MSDIRLERMVYGPRDSVVSAWCDPSLLAQWFCPNPATSVSAELDVSAAQATEVLLEHNDLADSDEASAHADSWGVTLERLDQLVRSW